MQVLTVLQARCSSSRLPNKVMRPLLGRPMLLRQIERVQRAKLIGTLVVATSTDQSDDDLAKLCQDHGIECQRGSLNDVLDRFYQVACSFSPDHVVRLTGDCPLADPQVIDKVISEHLATGSDYTSNALEPSYPDGLDVEVFRFTALERAWREGVLPSEREHVTPYIHKNPQLFRLHRSWGVPDLSHLRWTVDNPEDFALVEMIYNALYPLTPAFTSADILALIQKRPELATLNNYISRNEGYAISLAREANTKVQLGEK